MQEPQIRNRHPEELETVWKALASPVRRAILDQLRPGPQTTGGISESFPELTRFAVMQHLRVLVAADLVIARREGRKRFNYLNPVPIQQIFDRWVVRYMQPWTEALVSLRDQLETEASGEPARTQEEEASDER